MNKRLRHLRKELKLSQEEFGKRLGVTGAGISKIESGDRALTEQMLISICREFNVNENWLRNNEGEIFATFPVEDEYFKAATELSKNNDKIAMQAVIEYWKLDEDSKKLFRNFISSIADKSKE